MEIVVLVVAALIAVWLVVTGIRLVAHRQHPRGIAAHGLSGVFLLGVLGMAGLPYPVWFLWWVFLGGFGICVLIAAVRAARLPLADHEMKPPGLTTLVINAILAVLVVLMALLSG